MGSPPYTVPWEKPEKEKYSHDTDSDTSRSDSSGSTSSSDEDNRSPSPASSKASSISSIDLSTPTDVSPPLYSSQDPLKLVLSVMTPAYIPPIAALTSQNSAETLVGSRSSIEKGFPPEKCDASWFLASPTPSEIDSEIKWRRGPGFWRCFIAVCIPILLSAFEGSVVSTALPTISSALGIGSNSSWVATAFLLASIVFQPLYGQLADIWGRRHLMMFAVVIFCVGSIICGVTKSGAVLIFGRIVQGIGSGGIDLFAELILCDIIPLSKRGHYVAIKAAVYALGTTVGPLLGGVFAQGPPQMWRWCFYINIPVSIVALVMMMFWLRVTNGSGFVECSLKDKLKQVDYTGILLLTMAVVLFLFAMTTGGTVHPWLSPAIFVPLGIAVIELTAFVFWERSRWCTHPIMSPHVFSNRTTIAAFVITVLHGFITYAFQFYLPPFFQSVLGASPAQSGELILPCTLSIVIFASLGGPVLAKFGRYRLMHQVGFFLMIAGLTPCIFVNSSAKGLWILFSLLVGIGSGIIVSTTLPTVLVELTDKDNAAATGSWAFLRGLGSLLGVAIPNAVFNAQFELGLELVDDTAVRAQFGKGLAYEHASAAFISKLSPEIKNTIIDTFRESFKLVWGVFFAFAVFGFFVTWMENQVSLRKELDSDYGLEKKTKNVEKIIV